MIAAFLQLRNELENGNLRMCLDNVKEYADEIFIYDDCSTDGSRDVYLEYTKEKNIIFGDSLRFEKELFNKQMLLELALKSNPDWIVWQDGDAIFDRSLTKDCQYLLDRLEQDGFDGAMVHVLNLWRHPAFYRKDSGFNDLYYTCLWKNTGNLHYDPKPGLHQPQQPEGMTKVARLPENNAILHYGFASEERIAKKYLMYKALGQHDYPGKSMEPRLIDEISSFEVAKVPQMMFPPENVPEDYAIVKKPTPITYWKYKDYASWDDYVESTKLIEQGNLDAFWETAHKNKSKFWLTGSDPESVYQLHNLSAYLRENENLSILEIGVGYGNSVAHLSKRHKVTALDISEEALEKLHNCETVLTKNFDKIKDNSFDLILCHLVFQHCDDKMVKHLVSNSIRCLKPDGIFSFQFAYLPGEPTDYYRDTLNKVHFFRSPREMAEVVQKSGGKVLGVSAPKVFTRESNIHWHVLQCAKPRSTVTLRKLGPVVSIVMTYWNRKDQLFRTLKTIEYSPVHNQAEIIIIDDGSDQDQRIDDLPEYFDLDIHIHRLEEEDRWWNNPCIPYNMAFRKARGDLVIIQNPETLHMGDVLSDVVQRVNDSNWVTYSCYAIDQRVTDRLPSMEYLLEKRNVDLRQIIDVMTFPLVDAPSFKTDQTGWYNHPTIRKTAFHFLAATKRENLYRLQGFDERYAHGSSWDDNEIVRRARRMGLQILIVDPEGPRAIHQWHTTDRKMKDFFDLYYRNGVLFYAKTVREQRFEPPANFVFNATEQCI
jgi:SAM-dependent methyltransferase